MLACSYLVQLTAAETVRKRYFETEVDSAYAALEYEFVDAITATNRVLFKATKEADDIGVEATKDLWRCTRNLDFASEKAAFFEPNRAVLRATRLLVMIPSGADMVRTVGYDENSDAVKKMQLYEQKLMQFETDVLQAQDKFQSICTLSANGMTTASNLDGQEDYIGAVLVDVLAHRAKVAFSRASLVARYKAMRSGLPNAADKLVVGGKEVSLEDELPWTVPSTARFTPDTDIVVSEPATPVTSPDPPAAEPTAAAAAAGHSAPKASPRVARRVEAAPTPPMPVFGASLVGLKAHTNEGLPLIVRTVLPWLEAEERLKAEGIFRISGGAADVEALKAACVPAHPLPRPPTASRRI